MSTTLYSKATVPAQTKTPPYALSPENRLDLFPEQTKFLYRTCLEQLASCQLPLRCTRVFYVVLNQTIGYDKREDNMNGSYLQSVTQIRYDHANQALRDLAAMKVIILRKGGQYRNWASVNFNFAVWGNKQATLEQLNNDPYSILPDYYSKESIDQGIQLDVSATTLSQASQDISYTDISIPALQPSTQPPQLGLHAQIAYSNTPASHIAHHPKSGYTPTQGGTIHTKPTPKQVSSQPNLEHIVDKVEKMFHTLEEKLAQFEQRLHNNNQLTLELSTQLQQFEQQSRNTQTLTTELSDKLTQHLYNTDHVTTKLNTQLQQFKGQLQHLEQVTTVSESTPPLNHSSSVNTVEMEQSAVTVVVENNKNPKEPEPVPPRSSPAHANTKQALSECVQQAVNATHFEAPAIQVFNYPELLTHRQRRGLQDLLSKAGDNAQLILDVLAQRMQNTYQPIDDPIHYFADLLKQQKKGVLDSSGVKVNQEKQQQLRVQELYMDYQKKYHDCEGVERMVRWEIDKNPQTFEEALEATQMTNIWLVFQQEMQQSKQRWQQAKMKVEAKKYK
jgi:phage replication O-like protein O